MYRVFIGKTIDTLFFVVNRINIVNLFGMLKIRLVIIIY